MADPVLLFVWGEDRADAMRLQAPEALQIYTVLRCPAVKASAVLVEHPPAGASAAKVDAFRRWLYEWVPTRLPPGQDGMVIGS